MDFHALEKSLARGVVSPVYLFYGEENFLKDHFLERFKALIPEDFRDFNLSVLDGRETALDEIIDAAATLPFFSEKRLVIVKHADYFKARRKAQSQTASEGEPDSESGGEDGEGGERAGDETGFQSRRKGRNKNSETPLEGYLDNPLDSTCLIFCTEAMDRNLRVSKKVLKSGQVIEFAPLKNTALSGWIDRRARQLGILITPSASAKLVTAVGNNLRQLNSELEKLACFQEGTSITDGDVDLMVSRTVELSVFDLVDSIGERKAGPAIKMTREMTADGEPVLRLLFMIARQFRLLLRAKSLREKGIPDRLAAGEMQVHPYVAQKCLSQSRNFTLDELTQALEKILQTDTAIKTGRQEPMMALELMVIDLCAKKPTD